MAGINAIYFGELLDYHNYPAGGLNGQSGYATYSGSAIEKLNNNRGKRASLYHLAGVSSSRWLASGVFQPFSTYQATLDRIHADGMLTIWDWSPWSNVATDFINVRPAAIAAGNWNTQLHTFFAAVAVWGKEVLGRIGWEMQLSGQFPWQFATTGSWTIPAGNGWGGSWTNTIADFKNMWATIRSIRDAEGATNFKMAWVPNRHANSETATTYALIAPPMSQVDWLGVDTYPDYGSSLVDALRGLNAESYLGDNYAQLCALDSVKPILVGEFAWNQSNNSNVTVTSVTSTASTITVVVSTQPGSDTWTAGGNAIALAGMTPSAYNREWDIATVSGTGPYTLTITSATNPGTSTVNGTARFINRVQTAGLITSDLEAAGLPTSCPRLQALVEYHVIDGWPDDHHPLDVDGNNPASASFVAYRNAIGNAHYLAGQQMALDTSTKLWVPFQDQAVDQQGTGRPTAQERWLDVLRSATGLEGLWPTTEASGTSLADVSGKGRTATATGAIGVGTAGSMVPAEGTWSSLQFPATPATGNHMDCGNNAAFSIPTTGKLSLAIPFMLPTTPAAQSTLVSKVGFSGQLAGAVYEYQGWISATQIGFTINQTNGSTWASWAISIPGSGFLNVAHLLVIAIDSSLTNPIVVDFDGVTQVASSGITAGVGIAAGTAPLYFGEKFDNGSHLPISANARLGSPGVYSTFLSSESRAEIFNVWVAAPVVSGLSGTPGTGSLVIAFSTDIGGSTQVEYGPTTAYGSVSTYDPARNTSHGLTLSGLPGGTLHWRVRTRDTAGTETVGTDQTSTIAGNTTTFVSWYT
jgi:hypothetical protein